MSSDFYEKFDSIAIHSKSELLLVIKHGWLQNIYHLTTRYFFIRRIRMSYIQRRKAMPIQIELADFKVAPFPIS